jgi:molybdopterin-guanine dinucleotide biosynthesis protein A
LTNIVAVVEVDMKLEDYPFLQPLLQSSARLFKQDEQDLFLKWLDDKAIAVPIQGLVLAGGHSLRMGRDKSSIDYHGVPQREHILRMFEQLKFPVFLSCRPDQVVDLNGSHALIQDRITGMGPYGAILSAFMTAPDVAWLVVATDLPFVTKETLQQLIDQRNPSKIATAFHNTETGFPEPLITLWEPKAYPLLLSYLSQGNTCPRKALINSDVEIIRPTDPMWLKNANTPEDEISIREQLKTSRRFSK